MSDATKTIAQAQSAATHDWLTGALLVGFGTVERGLYEGREAWDKKADAMLGWLAENGMRLTIESDALPDGGLDVEREEAFRIIEAAAYQCYEERQVLRDALGRCARILHTERKHDGWLPDCPDSICAEYARLTEADPDPPRRPNPADRKARF